MCAWFLHDCLFCLCLLFLSVGGGVWGGHTFVFACALSIFILYIFIYRISVCLLCLLLLRLSLSVCQNLLNSVNSFEFVLLNWVGGQIPFGIRLTARMFDLICCIV